MPSGEVFFSYASADRARIEPLVRALEAQGLDVWWDRDIPRGKSYGRVIEEALQRARCAVVIWSHASVASEWVFNEASDARKRGILVPVLIDDIEPPLEFRHLQAARLSGWEGDLANEEFAGLLNAVRALVEQPGPAPPVRAETAPQRARAKPWWQTPAGMGLGAGCLLLGLAVFVVALKQVGLIGSGGPAGLAGPVMQAASAAQSPPSTPTTATPPLASGGVEAVSPTERTNLLDPEAGGKLVLANEDNWRSVMGPNLFTTVISSRGFAVFAFRDEKPATIDTVGVFVERADSRNVKQLAIYASDGSETGPFRKIAVLTVPNYRNMRAPFHEFTVGPFEARYVKVELLSWQDWEDMPNGYLGNLELLGALR